MPRRRTIFCPDCGYAQLKSDDTCDQCGAETEQSKARFRQWLQGKALQAGIALLAMLFILATLRSAGVSG